MNNFKTLSELFNDTIERYFGVKYEYLFNSDAVSNQKMYKKTYTDPLGNSAYALILEVNGKPISKRYFVNGEEKYNLPNSIASCVDAALPVEVPTYTICNKLPEPLVKGSDFPVINIDLNANKSMTILAALPGVRPDRVSLTFANDYLRIGVAAELSASRENQKKFRLLKGLKSSEGAYSKEIYIDPSKFDIKKLSFSHENGMLQVDIPGSEMQTQPTITFKSAAALYTTTNETSINTPAKLKKSRKVKQKVEETPKEPESEKAAE